MVKFRLLAVAVLVVPLVAACASHVEVPTKLPPRTIEPRTELAPETRPDPPPPHLAPPPAYGNKVVVAKAAGATRAATAIH